jgi:glycopeptide antibiotics resistance protein
MGFPVQHFCLERMRHFWLPLIWFFVILALCATPGKDIPHISFLEILAFDKWVHAGIFFVLAVLLMRALKRTYRTTSHAATLLITLSVCIVYGGLLEIMQGTVFEDRSADVLDFIANSFGAVCGVLVYRKLAKRMKFLYTA